MFSRRAKCFKLQVDRQRDIWDKVAHRNSQIVEITIISTPGLCGRNEPYSPKQLGQEVRKQLKIAHQNLLRHQYQRIYNKKDRTFINLGQFDIYRYLSLFLSGDLEYLGSWPPNLFLFHPLTSLAIYTYLCFMQNNVFS